MPIYLGGTRIDRLTLGGKNIGAGFLGNVKVFGSDGPLPALTLDDLTDVTITDPQGGQHLVRTTTEWVNL